MLIEICFVNNPDASTQQQKFEQICTAIAYALADYVQANPKPVAPVQLPELKSGLYITASEKYVTVYEK